MLMFFHAGVVREDACWVYSNTNIVAGSQVTYAALFIVDDTTGRILKNASPYIPKVQFLNSADVENLAHTAHSVPPEVLHKLVATYSTRTKATVVDIDAALKDAFLTKTFQDGIRYSLPKGM